jgi:tRNA(fMet)-specific endonuclease VapC
VSAIVVDTSVWVDFFRGQNLPALEQALREGLVLLAPLVAAELLSSPLRGAQRAQLESFLRDLPLHTTPFEHWVRVGELRAQAGRKGVNVSTPDAHIAQVARDVSGHVWSNDRIFARLRRASFIRCFDP